MMQPVLQSKERSTGQPRFLQVQQLITSFCFSSHTRMITEPFSFMLCLTEGGECIILKKTLGSTGDILYEMSILQSG